MNPRTRRICANPNARGLLQRGLLQSTATTLAVPEIALYLEISLVDTGHREHFGPRPAFV